MPLAMHGMVQLFKLVDCQRIKGCFSGNGGVQLFSQIPYAHVIFLKPEIDGETGCLYFLQPLLNCCFSVGVCPYLLIVFPAPRD